MRDLSRAKDPPAAWECPYCLSYKDESWPVPNAELILLNKQDAGYRCVVADQSQNVNFTDRFLVRMEYERRDILRSVMPGHDQYLDVRQYKVPTWMPELAIEDNAALHERLMQSLRTIFLADDRSSLAPGLHGIIHVCWWKRFPINGAELWPMLEAHGVLPRLRRDAIELIDFGLYTLRYAQGRAPNKRRRMPPMSQGRYLTKRHKEINIRCLGGLDADSLCLCLTYRGM